MFGSRSISLSRGLTAHHAGSCTFVLSGNVPRLAGALWQQVKWLA